MELLANISFYIWSSKNQHSDFELKFDFSHNLLLVNHASVQEELSFYLFKEIRTAVNDIDKMLTSCNLEHA